MKTPSFLHRFLAVSAACAVLIASAQAQAPAPGAPATPAAPGAAPAATPAPKPLGPAEKNFLKNAGKSLYYQLEVAKTTKSASMTEGLGRYRESTTKDLTKAWKAISDLAKSKGETLSEELTGADKSDVEKLGKLKAEKFTKEWLDNLTKEAKKLDKDFESAAKNLQDTDVKMFATNYGAIVRGVYTEGEKQEKSLKSGKK